LALARRDYRSAVTYLERALEQDPAGGSIHYPLAMAYQGLNDIKKAQFHLRQRGAGEIDPPDPLMEHLRETINSATSYVQQGDQAMQQGKLTDAISYYRTASSMAPTNIVVRERLGTVLFLNGDVAGAMDQFEAALRVSPGYARAHYSIGIILASQGRNAEAVKRFELAESADPAYLEARLARADVLVQMGRPMDSLPEYALVIKSGSRFRSARLGYGVALIRLGRYGEARDSLTESLKVVPDYQELALVLARLLAAAPDDQVRDGRLAMVHLQRLEHMDATVEGLEAAAMVAAELGNYGIAVMKQRLALDLARRAHRDDLLVALRANLLLYENRQPCRQPLTVGGTYGTLTTATN
jgi:tetratricopeptide (TPR) repeat protein